MVKSGEDVPSWMHPGQRSLQARESVQSQACKTSRWSNPNRDVPSLGCAAGSGNQYSCRPDMEGDPLGKKQKGVLCVGQVGAALASCELLVDAAQLAVDRLHGPAELSQPLLLQGLPLLLQPAQSSPSLPGHVTPCC